MAGGANMSQITSNQWSELASKSMRAFDEKRFSDSASLALLSVNIAANLESEREACMVKGLSLSGRADLYGTGNVIGACSSYERALQLLDSCHDIRDRDKFLVDVLFNLAETYSRSGQSAKAIPLLERALPICETLYGNRVVLTGKILYPHGLNSGLARDFDSSLKSLDRAATIFDELSDYENLMVTLADTANVCEFAGLHSDAARYRKHVDDLEKVMEQKDFSP
jgi:tetratricopeptide (TPR) repeat protein